ncbi:MAG: SRPBCC family protein [bacterium]
MYAQHEETNAIIAVPAEQAFAVLDDHARLSSHLSLPSWRVGGGKMRTIVDERMGRRVGSHIVLRGRVFGASMFAEEVVTVHHAPVRKVWETIGTPRLLVIGRYCMSFELAPRGRMASLRVAIDYDLPTRGVGRVLGLLFGRLYARWCMRQMTIDAVHHVALPAAAA